MENHNQLDQQIQASFQRATKQRQKLETQVSRYTIANITLGALATFAAGIPTLAGQPMIADSWRITCAVAALLTLAATILTSVKSQVAKPNTLAKASECVGRLRALLFELQAPDCDVARIRKQYQGILMEFADLAL